ncbi:hypothetical protein QQF64_029880 [Cirrhinus molitorella]|uniref:Uncharacterized protein n=1 Tax=Cirrhinus molitorella TaxID=172907 RepID=A0ABR3N1U4_9TELE
MVKCRPFYLPVYIPSRVDQITSLIVYQYVSFLTKGKNILDHIYSNVKAAYISVPHPHFRESDHLGVFLYPTYRQLLKQASPVSKTVQVWNEETDLLLQECFNTTNWDVFKATAWCEENCSVDLEENALVVTSYISMCTDNIVSMKCCKTFPNQKRWMNCEVRSMLHARSTAFASGDAEAYKKARYNLCRSIREAKRQYKLKLEG